MKQSERSHTPEPWEGEAGEIWATQNGRPVPIVFDEDLSREDAERIVACVNYCAGIPTAALVSGGGFESLRVQGEMQENVLEFTSFAGPDGISTPEDFERFLKWTSAILDRGRE